MIRGDINKKKSFLLNIIILIVTISFLLIISEVALRAIVPYSSLFKYSKDLEYEMRPNKHIKFNTFEFKTDVQTNSIGLRDKEYGEKDEDTFRILGLGDSFAFGQGVQLNGTFLKLLEEKLNKDDDRMQFEVINAGVPGYDTKRELEYLQKKGKDLSPDLILLTFVLNDPLSNSGVFYYTAIPNNALRYLPFHSFGFLATRFKNLRYSLNKFGLNVTSSYKSYCNNETSTKWGTILMMKNPPEFVDQAWNKTYAMLRNVSILARRSNSNFVIVLLPLKQHVFPDTADACLKISDYDFDIPSKILKKFSQEHNVQFIDLTPEFKKFEITQIYLKVDNHLTREGHRIVADYIYKNLINGHHLVRIPNAVPLQT